MWFLSGRGLSLAATIYRTVRGARTYSSELGYPVSEGRKGAGTRRHEAGAAAPELREADPLEGAQPAQVVDQRVEPHDRVDVERLAHDQEGQQREGMERNIETMIVTGWTNDSNWAASTM